MADDRAALLRELHDVHAPALWRFVVRLTGDDRLAEDVVQETLLRAWRRPQILTEDEAGARAWLFTVARNLVIDDRRSAWHRHELAAETLPEQPDKDRVEGMLEAWLVSDALAELSFEHRSVLVHVYYGGRSIAETAAELDIPPGTVKSRLHYGLRALRLALEEKGVTG
jgi:RNA polymerase sigma-70 factor, ECF subfamily